MSKSRIDTLAMFLLAGCIIFGGWFLTKSFLMRREVKYLNSIGQIAVQSSEITLLEESGQEDAVRQESGQQRAQEEEFHGVMMNEYERALVLSVWDYGGKELPHEPMNGQMNMEQAIDAGKKWIKNVAEYGVYTNKLQECDFDATKVNLCRIDNSMLYSNMQEEMYSYWSLRFVKEGVSVDLTLHAASGEVWKAKIMVETGDDEPVEVYDQGDLLIIAFPFMAANQETELIAYTEEREVKEGGAVKVNIENQCLCATVRQYQVQVNDEPARTVVDFELGRK